MTLLIVKATLILFAALALLRVSRRASASLRHRLAAATFGVLLLLPLVAVFAPQRVVTVNADVPAAITASHPGPLPAERGEGGQRPGEGSRTPIHWAAIALDVYIAGAALFALSLLGGIIRLHRLRANADVSVSGTKLAMEIASREGVRKPIEVMITGELAVPMTFGASHPTILLPAESADWDDVAMRRAIRHELEHIERGDWMTQILSRLACALYWPHPLVWALWQRLRLEAERACDDAVIRSDSAAEAYAEQLVTLARRIMGHGRVPALAMATRSNLGRRVEAILDRGLVRGRIGRMTSASVVVLALAVLIGVAPLRVMGAAAEDDRDVIRRYPTERESDPRDVALMKVAYTGDVESMRRLISAGANADAAIQGDGSPLMAAAQSGHVGAIELLIEEGADVNRGVRGDGNPLIAAARGGHVEAVRVLLDRGADIDRGVEGDGNALIAAAAHGNVDVVRFLLDRGADIERVIPGDENALIKACESGQLAAAQLLVQRGANVNARIWVDYGQGVRTEGEWRTPLKMARRHGAEEIVQLLLRNGARE
jgi:bla regulator protein blaR1